MSTLIRPEVNMKNKYWISKNRYRELLYFCKQYYDYQQIYKELIKPGRISEFAQERKKREHSDPTAEIVMRRDKFLQKMRLIEHAALQTDDELCGYIFKSVTEGKPYTYFEMSKEGIPCSRNTFYDRYRKFFWILDRMKN